MKNYKGTIIEESLRDKKILKNLKILSTKIEKVTKEHKTPWLSKWTLHTVEVNEKDANKIAKLLSKNLEDKHAWYIDYKNENYHYIIFKNKVFFIDRTKAKDYQKATEYGISLGIPDYQLDFSPEIKI